MNVNIRKAKQTDYLRINEMMLQVHNLHVKNRPDVYKEIQIPISEQDFNNIIKDDNQEIFVADNEIDNNVIGFCVIKFMETKDMTILVNNKFVYIDDICVDYKYKRKGIGKLIFNHIIDYSKSKGIKSIQLGVWEFNKEAIEFYENMGMSVRNVRMEMKL